MRNATVDSVCAVYADKGVKITVKPLPRAPKFILFEGDSLAFEFLGKLFLAHAKAVNGCGFFIAPKNAGSALFSKKATLGVYLHSLPAITAGCWLMTPTGRKSRGHGRKV